jgi:hypothetical protein
MMTWISKEQPTHIWNGDKWQRESDDKVFIADVRNKWFISKDGEKIMFKPKIIIGKSS